MLLLSYPFSFYLDMLQETIVVESDVILLKIFYPAQALL